MFVFAEKNNLKVVNTFFQHMVNKMWTWKSLNGETKNEMYFIVTNRLLKENNVVVFNKFKSTDHRMVRWKIIFYHYFRPMCFATS